jgi:hypothetical protein
MSLASAASTRGLRPTPYAMPLATVIVEVASAIAASETVAERS